ncbi:MAG: glycosyl hydrolase family 95 catalytic domain-containing protein [Armatimonadota bacterium]
MTIRTNMEQFLAQHDVVFLSPPLEGWEGLPIGNGSFGGPLWAAEDGLIFQANHSDTYELPDPNGVGDGGDYPDRQTGWFTLRSCGRLAMRFAAPIHNWIYLNDYRADLSLYRAQASYSARTAFGQFETTAYIHAERPVAVFRQRAEYFGDLAETGGPVEITLERWGSRVFGWWYASVQGGGSIDLGNAKTSVDGGDICLQTTLRGGVTVALRCRVLGAGAQARVNHNHQAQITVDAAPVQEFTILLACVTSLDHADPAAAARQAIEEAAAAPDLEAGHRAWWAEYWDRSFLHVSDGLAENLYYLHQYYMGASSRGHYPALFNASLWIWNHDVRNWANPHHWNEQQSYWCLPAANRLDLLRSYLDTYHRLMPRAIESTQRRGYQGMLWVDQHDFSGKQVAETYPSFMENYTPASQIGLFFWWHYRYSGDLAYFREKGYPFMVAAADFYLGYLHWRDDLGRYEIPLATTYEDERDWRFTDTITNLSMIRATFPILVKMSRELGVDEERREKWQHVLDHLPPYLINENDAKRGPVLGSGLLDGKVLPPDEGHNHAPIMCPIMPAGDIGLKDRGTPLFDAACNSIITFHEEGITPTISIAARLGLADVARERVHNYAQRHIGLFCSNLTCDRSNALKNVKVRGYAPDGIEAHLAEQPNDPFLQMLMEPLGLTAAGIQEMLLQSHEGVIRVFPATPDDWEAAFILLAEGGFTVTSRKEAGRLPEFIAVESRWGGRCVVQNPWGKAQVRDGDALISVEANGEALAFETQPGRTYQLLPAGAGMPAEHQYSGVRNTAPKIILGVTIGKPRNF